MQKLVIGSSCLTLVFASVFAAAASPTTAPAKPATQPIPKNWVKIENTKYNYVFYVPPKWQKNVIDDTQAAFLLPCAMNKKPPLFLLVGSECHESTMQAEADSARKDYKDAPAKLKIVTDQATTFGGQPAWSFVVQGTQIEEVPPTTPTAKPRSIKHKVSILEIVTVQGKVIYHLHFEANDSAYSDNLRTVQHVIDSFAWVPPVQKP